MTTLERWIRFLPALIFIEITALILWLKPGYGLMDDGGFVASCSSTTGGHLIPTTVPDLMAMIQWGILRPFYPAIAHMQYCWTGNSVELFLFNTLSVFALWVALGMAFWSILPRDRVTDRSIFLTLFILGTLGFFRTHDLFLHPSLQEKHVLAILALCLGVMSREWFWRLSLPRLTAMSLALMVLGCLMKTQFLVFAPALTLIAWVRGGLNKASIFAIHTLVLTFVFGWITRQGGYTSYLKVSSVWDNLHQRPAHALILMGAAASLALWRLNRPRYRAPWRDWVWDILPLTLCVSYVAFFSPWNLTDCYLYTLISFVAGLSCATLYPAFSKWPHLQRLGLFGLAILAVSLTTYREYRNFGRLSDLHAVLRSPELAHIVRSGMGPVYSSCEEGVGHMKYYFKTYTGLDATQTLRVRSEPPPGSAHPGPAWVIADSALCGFPRVAGEQILMHGRFQGSFELRKLP